jgi:hypothetical protein
MYLFYKHIKNKKLHIFIISFLIFIFLNITENFIHYNIGRHNENDIVKLILPSKRDWIKIIIVMVVFAFLQGWFTYLLE